MTDGPERARLRTYLTGAKDEASDLAGDNWRLCGDILKDTAFALRRGAKQIRDGEGDGADGGLSGMMADALLAAGDETKARDWFSRAADADDEGETDAADRLAELDGIVLVDLLEGEDDEARDASGEPNGSDEPSRG